MVKGYVKRYVHAIYNFTNIKKKNQFTHFKKKMPLSLERSTWLLAFFILEINNEEITKKEKKNISIVS